MLANSSKRDKQRLKSLKPRQHYTSYGKCSSLRHSYAPLTLIFYMINRQIERKRTHCFQLRNIFLRQHWSNFNSASWKTKVNRAMHKNTFLIIKLHHRLILAQVMLVNSITVSCMSWHFITTAAACTESERLHKSLRQWLNSVQLILTR